MPTPCCALTILDTHTEMLESTYVKRYDGKLTQICRHDVFDIFHDMKFKRISIIIIQDIFMIIETKRLNFEVCFHDLKYIKNKIL